MKLNWVLIMSSYGYKTRSTFLLHFSMSHQLTLEYPSHLNMRIYLAGSYSDYTIFLLGFYLRAWKWNRNIIYQRRKNMVEHNFYFSNICISLSTCKEFDNHSIDSSKPSPRIALALKIWNVRFFNASSPSAWCT